MDNRAYPENANFKTCAPSTLKFYTFCGLQKTMNCWIFELDTFNISWVTAAKKCKDYIKKMLKMYLERYKCAIITYFILQCYCIKYCIKVLFLKRMLSYLADLCLDCVSITMYCLIYNFWFVYENNNIFLSNDHIWYNRNLDSHISRTHSDISFKLSGFYILTNCYK